MLANEKVEIIKKAIASNRSVVITPTNYGYSMYIDPPKLKDFDFLPIRYENLILTGYRIINGAKSDHAENIFIEQISSLK